MIKAPPMEKIETRVEIGGDVAKQAPAAEERGRRWARENAEAIQVHNNRIAERGVFGEDLRRW